jgi:hypothetical protein
MVAQTPSGTGHASDSRPSKSAGGTCTNTAATSSQSEVLPGCRGYLDLQSVSSEARISATVVALVLRVVACQDGDLDTHALFSRTM